MNKVEDVRESLPVRMAKVRGDRSQRRAARDNGIPQQVWNRYELGDIAPSFDALAKIALNEKVNLNWLVLGREEMR